MNKVKLLDCTLRDGGYVNNWRFGKAAVADITHKLERTGVEILELGFLKDEPNNEDRTVFNSIEEAKKLIGVKKPGLRYAVMAEVANPLPLDKITPYDGTGPEIIRVIVWKRLLREGFDYCKGIVEKGYKLCVQPARVSQYKPQEFIEMIKLFNALDPLAVYVVDSWGTMYKDALVGYLKLADEHLKPGIAVGYHGHNNMMQAFDAACAFAEQKLTRDIIIDASVYGIGRGAGNLNTELFARYMNEKHGCLYDLTPMTEVYDSYISKIYETCKWGYSVPQFICAKYNCNPDYGGYYEKMGLPSALIEKIISTLPLDEKLIFKRESADKYLLEKQKLTEEYKNNISKISWKNKLCLIIPTANRPKLIDKHIRAICPSLTAYDIDLVIFDSSKDGATKKIVEKYQKAGVSNLIYDFYEGPADKMSIDKKVLCAYAKYAKKYEYLWAVRDGLLVKLENILPGIADKISAGRDLIVLNHTFHDYNVVDLATLDFRGKTYTDCRQLFVEQCKQMIVLGATIAKSQLLLSIMKEVPLDMEKNYGIWQPVAFFEYFASRPFTAASYVDIVWQPIEAEKTSFWFKKTFWQWGERWFKSITALPAVYNPYKARLLNLGIFFKTRLLMDIRKRGGFNIFTVYKNSQYLTRVCDIPLRDFYCIACIPRIYFLFARWQRSIKKRARALKQCCQYRKN